MSNPGPVSIASDTDESERSEDSLEQQEGTPLIHSLSDSGSENSNSSNNHSHEEDSQEEEEHETEFQSSMNDIDGDDNEEEDEAASNDDDDSHPPKPKPEFPKIMDEFTDATPLECLQNEPADHYDWKELCLARVSLLGTPETGMQAMITQVKNGAESGCADKSVARNQTTKNNIQQAYVMVEQPMGYVIRVTGYHAQAGTPCLLHSLKLQFASGQVIELQGTTDSYKGEPFIVDDLDDNFYLASIDFQEGKCIGYSGYSTEKPIHEVMEEESLADEDLLNDALEDSEGGDNNDPFNPSNPKKNKKSADNTGNMSPPGDDDGDSWYGESLPAIELPRPEGDDQESWRISHICLLGDLGLRGCIIHYYDGKRYGFLQKKDLQQTSVYDYEEIEQSGGQFIEVKQPGGYITKINGYHMRDVASKFLCNSLQLEFESGQVIDFAGEMDAGKGKYFSYDAPEDFYIHQLRFDGDGKLSSVAGIRTDDVGIESPPMEVPEVQTKPKKTCCCC